MDTDKLASAANTFAHKMAPDRTERYATINSGDTLAIFQDAGLTLRDVVKQKVRANVLAREGFQRHIFRFDSGIMLPDNSKLEVLLRNSYDGTSTFNLSLGVFRIVCSNGLVAGTSFGRVSIKHAGKDTIWSKVQEGITKTLEQKSRMYDTVGRWLERDMTGNATAFAQRAAYKILPAGATLIDESALLNLRRTEDQPHNLWTLFNRVQENALHGGILYRKADDEPGTVRRTRTLRGANKIFDANVALWDMANEVDAEFAR